MKPMRWSSAYLEGLSGLLKTAPESFQAAEPHHERPRARFFCAEDGGDMIIKGLPASPLLQTTGGA